MTLAVLGHALPKSFAQTLQIHKGKVGQSYDKIILELGLPSEKPPVKKVDPVVVEEAAEVGSEMDESWFKEYTVLMSYICGVWFCSLYSGINVRNTLCYMYIAILWLFFISHICVVIVITFTIIKVILTYN